MAVTVESRRMDLASQGGSTMAVEDDYAQLARELERAYLRDKAADGRTFVDMQVQMDALWRQRRARRGYHPHGTGPTGATGPTGPGP